MYTVHNILSTSKSRRSLNAENNVVDDNSYLSER